MDLDVFNSSTGASFVLFCFVFSKCGVNGKLSNLK